jgi:putative peptidoglycan lipid II flippase
MVVVAGSINAAIIPILTDELYDKGSKQFNKLFKQLTSVFFLLCAVLVFIIFLFAPTITDWVVNNEYASKVLNIGYRIDNSDYNQFLTLFRIGLLSPLFLSLSAFVTAYLQIKKQFFITTLAPLFYNLAMIVGTYVLVLFFKLDVTGIAISAVVGSVIHLLIQIPKLIKYYRESNGQTVSVKEVIGNSSIVKAFRLALPRMFSVLGEQFNTVVNTFISFTLTAGALSAYKFAFSLHLFPINIIGSAVAQVALPDLAKHSCKNEEGEFKKVLNDSIQLSLYLIFPIVAIMLVLRLPIVRLIYGTGAFDWQDTLLTAWCLALLSISVIGQTVMQILLRAFYALKNTWRPVIAIMFGIVVNLLGAYYITNFFSHYYDWRPILEQVWVQIASANGEGLLPVLKSFLKDMSLWVTTRGDSTLAVGGLALSISLSYFLQTIISVKMLNKVKRVLSWKETMYPVLLKVVNMLIMIVGMYVVFKLFDFKLDTSRTVYVLILTAVTSSYGFLSYLLGSKVFSPKEYGMALNIFKRIKGRFTNGTNLMS